MSYYFAARYSRHPEMREYRDELVAALPTAAVTSRWIDCHGGEVKTSWPPEVLAVKHVEAWKYGLFDLEDLQVADAIVSFSGTGGKGGRHIEHGFAIASDKRLVLIGSRENVFHCHPGTELYETWTDFLKHEVEGENSK